MAAKGWIQSRERDGTIIWECFGAMPTTEELQRKIEWEDRRNKKALKSIVIDTLAIEGALGVTAQELQSRALLSQCSVIIIDREGINGP